MRTLSKCLLRARITIGTVLAITCFSACNPLGLKQSTAPENFRPGSSYIFGIKADHLQVKMGSGQSANVNSELALPIEVEVDDLAGYPIPYIVLSFSIDANAGKLSAGLVTTDINGHASVTWTMGSTAGTYYLTVTPVIPISGTPNVLQIPATAVATFTGWFPSSSTSSSFTASSSLIYTSNSIKISLPITQLDFLTNASSLGCQGFDTANSSTGVTLASNTVTVTTSGTTTNNVEFSADWTPSYSNIVNYWNMNGTLGNSPASVTSTIPSGGSALTGTVSTSSGNFKYVNGKLNQTLNFGGSDWITVASSGVPTGSTSRTASLWYYPKAIGSTYVIYFWGTQSNNAAQGLCIGCNTLTGLRYYGWNNDLDCFPSIRINEWMHMATTFDGTTAKIYVDGVLCASMNAASWNTVGNTLKIGSDGFSSINGYLDEFAIWNTALSAADIATIYARQAPTFSGTLNSRIMDSGNSIAWDALSWITNTALSYATPNSGSNGILASLYGLWHLDDAGPTTAADSSSSGYTATAHGTTTFGSTGQLNKAATFDGSTGYLQSILSTITTPAAVSMWINNASLTGGGFFGAGNSATSCGTGNNSLRLYQYRASELKAASGTAPVAAVANSAGITVYLCDSQAAIPFPSFATTGNWHHVAVSFDGTFLWMSVDGTFPAGDFGSGGGFSGSLQNQPFNLNGNNSTTGPIAIGYSFDTIAGNFGGAIPQFFNGSIDEVAIFNQKLTPLQMSELYQVNRVKFRARSCTTSNCSDDPTGANWVGPDGTNKTYFTNSNNATSSQSSGTMTFSSCTGCTGGLSLGGKRYAQYQVVLESMDDTGSFTPPQLSLVTLGPNTTRAPTLITGTGVSYTTLLGFSVTYGSGGCLLGARFDITNDTSQTNWYSWNGSSWALNTTGFLGANLASTVDSNIGSFVTQRGTGTLYVRAYLTSDGTVASGQCEIKEIQAIAH